MVCTKHAFKFNGCMGNSEEILNILCKHVYYMFIHHQCHSIINYNFQLETMHKCVGSHRIM